MSINVLPVECISSIFSFTSPKDACRFAAVSPTFRSAAHSDDLWKSFLPSDYQEIISQSSSPSYLNSLSKKALYFHLCDHPLLICNGNSSFTLEKWSGRRCYMIGARDLEISQGNNPQYWTWKSLPQSRFSEVAELDNAWWLNIKGKIEARKLTPKTNYIICLVFEAVTGTASSENRRRNEFDQYHSRVLCRVYFERSQVEVKKVVLWNPHDETLQPFRERLDGWKEIEIGEIYNELGDDGSIIFSVKEVSMFEVKYGLVVEGVEIRHKPSSFDACKLPMFEVEKC